LVFAIISRQIGRTSVYRWYFIRNGTPDAKKNELKPWKVVGWVIPAKENGEFVAAMEKILDVYKRPYDPMRPVI
jgi:hypothetical protein